MVGSAWREVSDGWLPAPAFVFFLSFCLHARRQGPEWEPCARYYIKGQSIRLFGNEFK